MHLGKTAVLTLLDGRCTVAQRNNDVDGLIELILEDSHAAEPALSSTYCTHIAAGITNPASASSRAKIAAALHRIVHGAASSASALCELRDAILAPEGFNFLLSSCVAAAEAQSSCLEAVASLAQRGCIMVDSEATWKALCEAGPGFTSEFASARLQALQHDSTTPADSVSTERDPGNGGSAHAQAWHALQMSAYGTPASTVAAARLLVQNLNEVQPERVHAALCEHAVRCYDVGATGESRELFSLLGSSNLPEPAAAYSTYGCWLAGAGGSKPAAKQSRGAAMLAAAQLGSETNMRGDGIAQLDGALLVRVLAKALDQSEWDLMEAAGSSSEGSSGAGSDTAMDVEQAAESTSNQESHKRSMLVVAAQLARMMRSWNQSKSTDGSNWSTVATDACSMCRSFRAGPCNGPPPSVPQSVADARRHFDSMQSHQRLLVLNDLLKHCHMPSALASMAAIAGAVFFFTDSESKAKEKGATVVGDYIPSHFGPEVRGLRGALAGTIEAEDVPVAGAVAFTVLCRLRVMEPWNERWALGMGDLLLALGRHMQALQHYLLAAALQTSFFSTRSENGVIVKRGSEDSAQSLVLLEDKMLPRVVHCLVACKNYTAAIVLCQCFNPPDYASAFAYAQNSPGLLSTEYFRYLWEVPILERLIQITSHANDEVKKTALMRVIQNPELNEFNSKETRQAYTAVLKTNFFKALFMDIGSCIPAEVTLGQ